MCSERNVSPLQWGLDPGRGPCGEFHGAPSKMGNSINPLWFSLLELTGIVLIYKNIDYHNHRFGLFFFNSQVINLKTISTLKKNMGLMPSVSLCVHSEGAGHENVLRSPPPHPPPAPQHPPSRASTCADICLKLSLLSSPAVPHFICLSALGFHSDDQGPRCSAMRCSFKSSCLFFFFFLTLGKLLTQVRPPWDGAVDWTHRIRC